MLLDRLLAYLSMETHQNPTQMFISYAEEDKVQKEMLDKHLSALQRQGIITSFDAAKINAGDNWNKNLQQHLAAADIILLLLSADAIADDYLHNKQLQKALKRAEKKEAIVIPILLRSVDYQGLGLGKYAVLPSNGKAVTSWDNQDEAYEHIAAQIRKVVEHLNKLKSGDLYTYETIFVNDQDAAPELPVELAEDLITNDMIWVKSLKQEFVRHGISVKDRPSAIFQQYGWLIETFLQKMNTPVGKKRNLRRLSFMAEAFQSSVRYLCYIQLAQVLINQQQATAPAIAAFFKMNETELAHFDWLNFLITTDSLLGKEGNFMVEISNFVVELTNTQSDLYGVSLFLEKNRYKLLKDKIQEDELLDQLLNEYLTALVFWLRKIAFLAKYRLVSIKDINLNYRLGSTKNFVHLYGELHGMYSETYSEQGDFMTHSIQDFFTFNKSVLLFKGRDIENCLNNINDQNSYLSLSPLIIDQSVFAEKETQTPEIYYYIGKDKRRYHFAQYKNELVYGTKKESSSNKTLKVKVQNNNQPKLDELFEQMEGVIEPFK
ncbi:MAG: toll/interleukin-1 receptor domain-containing protein [Chitinophagales bacterium]